MHPQKLARGYRTSGGMCVAMVPLPSQDTHKVTEGARALGFASLNQQAGRVRPSICQARLQLESFLEAGERRFLLSQCINTYAMIVVRLGIERPGERFRCGDRDWVRVTGQPLLLQPCSE